MLTEYFFHRAPLFVIDVFSKEMLLEVSTDKVSGRPYACITGNYVLPKTPSPLSIHLLFIDYLAKINTCILLNTASGKHERGLLPKRAEWCTP